MYHVHNPNSTAARLGLRWLSVSTLAAAVALASFASAAEPEVRPPQSKKVMISASDGMKHPAPAHRGKTSDVAAAARLTPAGEAGGPIELAPIADPMLLIAAMDSPLAEPVAYPLMDPFTDPIAQDGGGSRPEARGSSARVSIRGADSSTMKAATVARPVAARAVARSSATPTAKAAAKPAANAAAAKAAVAKAADQREPVASAASARASGGRAVIAGPRSGPRLGAPVRISREPVASAGGGQAAPNPGGAASNNVSGNAAAAAPAKAIILSHLTPALHFNETTVANGVETLLVLGQNNFDPEAKIIGKVSGEKMVAGVKAELGPNPSGWVMFDYEDPMNEVFDNGFEDPRLIPMLNSMIEGMKYAKAQLPNCKFTYYGVPTMRYWITGGGWEKAPQWSQMETIDKKFKLYETLVAELDWISPAVYDRYDYTKHDAVEQASMKLREPIYRKKMVELAVRLREAVGKPDMPIIASVSLVYEGGGSGVIWEPLKTEEFLHDQIVPCLAAGADGAFLWSSLNYQSWIAGLASVPTAAEATRANARAILTKLFYDNVEPSAWSTAEAKATTATKIGDFLSTYVTAVRTAEESAAQQVAGGGNSK
ncbi:MAG: hypothetical protein SGJ11_11710 [Phycisphaerae bacterium]|nr:hypothetical protein [Phycisphaerae bacterium]